MRRYTFELADECGEEGSVILFTLKETCRFEIDHLEELCEKDPQEALRIKAKKKIEILNNVINKMIHTGIYDK